MKKMSSLLVLTFAILVSVAWTSFSFPQATTQTIKICKEADGAGSTLFPFRWSNAGGDMPSFTLKAGECVLKTVDIKSGPNVFKESLPAGWSVANISCDNNIKVNITGAGDAPGFQAGDNTVAIDSRGPSAVCTFTNQAPAVPCCDFNLDISTGQGTGPKDPSWSLSSNPTYITPKFLSWIDLPAAKWIQPSAPALQAEKAGLYKYSIKFDVPACASGRVELSGTFAADNGGQAFLDGTAIPGASCPGPWCFATPKAPVPLNLATVAPGAHTLRIDVINDATSPSSSTGLIVNAKLKRVCITNKTPDRRSLAIPIPGRP